MPRRLRRSAGPCQRRPKPNANQKQECRSNANDQQKPDKRGLTRLRRGVTGVTPGRGGTDDSGADD